MIDQIKDEKQIHPSEHLQSFLEFFIFTKLDRCYTSNRTTEITVKPPTTTTDCLDFLNELSPISKREAQRIVYLNGELVSRSTSTVEDIFPYFIEIHNRVIKKIKDEGLIIGTPLKGEFKFDYNSETFIYKEPLNEKEIITKETLTGNEALQAMLDGKTLKMVDDHYRLYYRITHRPKHTNNHPSKNRWDDWDDLNFVYERKFEVME